MFICAICGRNKYSSVGERFSGNSWESRVTEVIDDGTHLAGGEELTVAVVACGMQLSKERLVAVDPTHQMVRGGARIAVGKIEHCKLLFAVTSDIHFW